MSKHLKRAALAVIISVFATTPHSASGKPVPQNDEGRGPEPIVDRYGPGKNGHVSAAVRRARNVRHNDARAAYPISEMANAEPGPLIRDFSSTSALPVSQSDLIIIGQVKSADAYLSDDATNVYSEFEVAVERLLKRTPTSTIAAGTTIDCEREGGAVRFPSGRVYKFRIYEQGFPKLGRRYVLFLKIADDTAEYSIITGYELRGGKVEALDGVGFEKETNPKFKKYVGDDEQTFLDKLSRAVGEGGAAK